MLFLTRKDTATVLSAVKLEDSDDDSFDDEDFTAPAKKVQKQGSGTTAGTSHNPRAAAKPPTGATAKGFSGAAAPAQPAKARPASGGSRPSSAEGGKPSSAGASRPASAEASKAPGPNRPGSGGSGKGAGDKPAVKSRPLVASTTKVSCGRPCFQACMCSGRTMSHASMLSVTSVREMCADVVALSCCCSLRGLTAGANLKDKWLQDKAFADGGLDPISDDSDDEIPLAQRR